MSPIVAFAITEAIQYGPAFIKQIIELCQKKDLTIAEIDAAFASVKPYDAWNIPNIPTQTPTSPVIPGA